MKKFTIYTFTAICIALSIVTKAQIGINTTNPDPSSAIHVNATNKGLSIPTINITSRTDISQLAAPPKESLIIYNNNANVTGGKALYFWDGSKWDFMFNDLNSNLLQDMIRYEFNSNSINVSSNKYSNDSIALGTSINDVTWKEITDLKSTIEVSRDSNDLLFIVSGMVQSPSNYSTTNTAYLGFGIFIDNKLVSLTPFNFPLTGNCSYKTFKVVANTKNVTIGSRKIRYAFTNFKTKNADKPTISYGSKASNCTNISDLEARIASSVIVNQPITL